MSDVRRVRVARAVAVLRGQLRAPFAATAGAIVLLWASLTPSLMPRAWYLHGVPRGQIR